MLFNNEKSPNNENDETKNTNDFNNSSNSPQNSNEEKFNDFESSHPNINVDNNSSFNQDDSFVYNATQNTNFDVNQNAPTKDEPLTAQPPTTQFDFGSNEKNTNNQNAQNINYFSNMSTNSPPNNSGYNQNETEKQKNNYHPNGNNNYTPNSNGYINQNEYTNQAVWNDNQFNEYSQSSQSGQSGQSGQTNQSSQTSQTSQSNQSSQTNQFGQQFNNQAQQQNNIPNWQSYNQSQYPNYQMNPNPNIKKKKVKKEKKNMSNRSVAVVSVLACIISSLLFGFGGTILANQLGFIQSNDTSNTVFYQSVQKTNPDGSEIGKNLSVEQIAEITTPSVVEITTEKVTTGSFLQQYVAQGAGSGVILSNDGYIITNNHVISGANTIKVRTKDGTSYDAKLIGTDTQTDIAVIKIEATGLTAAVLGDSSSLVVGQMTVAVGNPLGRLGGTVTDGIISALDREVAIENETMTLLQTNTAINPGNSGGGLFNGRGELVGIVNAKSSGTDVEGLGFAIPINQVKTVSENIIKYGYVKGRVVMGISVITISDTQNAMYYRVNQLGLYVAKVNNNSTAERAGILAGDCIEEVDGTKVMTSADLNKVMNNCSVGQEINLKIKRGTQSVQINLILDEYKPE